MNLECINCDSLFLFECQSTCYQIAVKLPQKWYQYLRPRLEKENSRSITITLTKIGLCNKFPITSYSDNADFPEARREPYSS